MLVETGEQKAKRALRVFLAHASENKGPVHSLANRLQRDGFAPWLDEKELLPGQTWREEVRRAVNESDVVLICLSKMSVEKEGFFQKEIRYALEGAKKRPHGTIFIIPLRLEDNSIPRSLAHLQAADLLKENGYEKLIQALNKCADDLGYASAPPANPFRYVVGWSGRFAATAAGLVLVVALGYQMLGWNSGAATSVRLENNEITQSHKTKPKTLQTKRSTSSLMRPEQQGSTSPEPLHGPSKEQSPQATNPPQSEDHTSKKRENLQNVSAGACTQIQKWIDHESDFTVISESFSCDDGSRTTCQAVITANSDDYSCGPTRVAALRRTYFLTRPSSES